MNIANGITLRPVTMTDDKWLDYRVAGALSGVVSDSVLVSPGMAEALLRRNDDNRSITRHRVDLYAKDMIAGNWRLNGEPIIISREGLLNDGQHRLAAIIKTGIPMQCMMTFGIERETRTTTNQGGGKGAGDYLKMSGVKNSNIVAGAARMLCEYDASGGTSCNTSHITNAQTMKRVDNDLVELSSFIIRHKEQLKPFVAPSPALLCYYLFSHIDSEAADRYFVSVASGLNLGLGNPALAVRNKLLAMPRGREDKIEVIMHGWNAYRTGRKLTLVKVLGAMPKI